MKPGGGGIGGGRRLGRLDANSCFVSSDLLESKDWSVVLSISSLFSSRLLIVIVIYLLPLLFEQLPWDSADRESPSPESSSYEVIWFNYY